MVSEDDDEVGMIENKKDFETFANQMKYNIVICQLNLNNRKKAI